MAFVWVNWAIHARQSEIVLGEFLDALGAEHPDCVVPVYRADVSEQQGYLWQAVRHWLAEEGQPVDPLTCGGCGALVWISRGSIVASTVNVAAMDREKLMDITRKAFGCRASA